jgi:hypothetical protein
MCDLNSKVLLGLRRGHEIDLQPHLLGYAGDLAHLRDADAIVVVADGRLRSAFQAALRRRGGGDVERDVLGDIADGQIADDLEGIALADSAARRQPDDLLGREGDELILVGLLEHYVKQHVLSFIRADRYALLLAAHPLAAYRLLRRHS